jgi:hypothetical protein
MAVGHELEELMAPQIAALKEKVRGMSGADLVSNFKYEAHLAGQSGLPYCTKVSECTAYMQIQCIVYTEEIQRRLDEHEEQRQGLAAEDQLAHGDREPKVPHVCCGQCVPSRDEADSHPE